MQYRLQIIPAGAGITLVILFGVAAGVWFARASSGEITQIAMPQRASASERKVLYYRDPSDAPFWSATPKKNAAGRDYVPVYEDEEPSFGPGGERKKFAAENGKARKVESNEPRKLLYYRNPMGLPDTSPVPKKDWMGMDYIAVYEGDEQDDGGTVRISLDKIQRSGVRTEIAEERVIIRSVRAVGAVKPDESRLTVVTMRSDGYIEELFVSKTGQQVRAGEPLFRVYSPDIVSAQVNLRNGGLGGGEQRLRNFGVPESHIAEILAGKNPMSLVWSAPVTGDVIEKKVINGQKVKAGDELYRIADLTHVWVIADVAEADLAGITPGTRATITFRAFPFQPMEGEVTFIYPDLKPETRTARVRIELPNNEGKLRADMYADIVLHVGADSNAVVTVPDSAVIDSGNRQVVLIAKGEGRFEPRAVKLGRHGDGYWEIMKGVVKGEEVVTAATFLIDAESNLKAALKNFTQQEAAK